MFDTTITLIARKIVGKDSRMKPIYKETLHETLCIDEPVSRSEFFAASQIGINPESLVVINPIEYHGEKIALYHDRRMSIYRTYKRSDNELEIYLQLAVGLNAREGGSNES